MSDAAYQLEKLNHNADHGRLVTCCGYAVLDIKIKELLALAIMVRQAEATGGTWGAQPGCWCSVGTATSMVREPNHSVRRGKSASADR